MAMVGGGAMKFTKVQLIVTLVALLASGGILAIKGLPASRQVFDACDDGDCEQVQRALNWGVPVEITRRTSSSVLGCTLLQGAAADGNKSMAELLIIMGADINARSESGGAPLYWAASQGRTEVAGFLIAQGADVDIGNNDGVTPLSIAASWGDTDMAELLIAKGADVNSRDSSGGTPLHFAAYYSSLLTTDAARLIIAKGANLNVKDAEGRTPLRLAVERGKKELAELLRQHGAKE